MKKSAVDDSSILIGTGRRNPGRDNGCTGSDWREPGRIDGRRNGERERTSATRFYMTRQNVQPINALVTHESARILISRFLLITFLTFLVTYNIIADSM